MRRLLINADDLGADEARNAGIFEAIEAGVLASASLLANGPAFEDAVRRARALAAAGRAAFGVHLVLSEGRPLARGLRRLVGADGCFLGKAAARRLLREAAAAGDRALFREVAAEVAAEARAQIDAVRAAGIAPAHLDGHQHVHVYPAAVEAVLDAAAEAGIRRVRLPEEPDPPREGALCAAAEDEETREELRVHRDLAARARGLLAARAIFAFPHLRGIALKDRLAPDTLAETVRALPEGTTELMCHPARLRGVRASPGPFSAFLRPARERELEALLDPGFRALLERENIRLLGPHECAF